MKPMRLDEFTAVVGCEAPLDSNLVATGVSTDTRSIEPGDIFIAIDGPRFRGSDHVPEAFRAGAIAAVTPRRTGTTRPEFVVEDPVGVLGRLAAHVRTQMSIDVVGITGSNGKTTTKDAIAVILGGRFKVASSPASFNNAIGVALSILNAPVDAEILVLEIGTNAPGEIAHLAAMARPTVAVLTSIAPGHLEGLGGIEGVLREKLDLARAVPTQKRVFLNGDDDLLYGADTGNGAEVNHFGFDPRCDVLGIDASYDERGVSFQFESEGPRIESVLRGRHNLLNLLGACAVGRAFGLDDCELRERASLIVTPHMRLETRQVDELEVVFDCYNANPASMDAALDHFCADVASVRRVAVLGDMLELGAASEDYHRRLGHRLAASDLDFIALVGPASRAAYEEAVHAGLGARTCHFDDVARGAAAIRGHLRPGDRVLLKGSRGMHLETLFETGGTS